MHHTQYFLVSWNFKDLFQKIRRELFKIFKPKNLFKSTKCSQFYVKFTRTSLRYLKITKTNSKLFKLFQISFKINSHPANSPYSKRISAANPSNRCKAATRICWNLHRHQLAALPNMTWCCCLECTSMLAGISRSQLTSPHWWKRFSSDRVRCGLPAVHPKIVPRHRSWCLSHQDFCSADSHFHDFPDFHSNQHRSQTFSATF